VIQPRHDSHGQEDRDAVAAALQPRKADRRATDLSGKRLPGQTSCLAFGVQRPENRSIPAEDAVRLAGRQPRLALVTLETGDEALGRTPESLQVSSTCWQLWTAPGRARSLAAVRWSRDLRAVVLDRATEAEHTELAAENVGGDLTGSPLSICRAGRAFELPGWSTHC